MPRAPFRKLRQRLADMLLTTDPIQRLRLAQSGLAMVLMALSVAILVYAARLAGTPALAVAGWATLSLGVTVAFFASPAGMSSSAWWRFSRPSASVGPGASPIRR